MSWVHPRKKTGSDIHLLFGWGLLTMKLLLAHTKADGRFTKLQGSPSASLSLPKRLWGIEKLMRSRERFYRHQMNVSHGILREDHRHSISLVQRKSSMHLKIYMYFDMATHMGWLCFTNTFPENDRPIRVNNSNNN